jgi:hypothetical protein
MIIIGVDYHPSVQQVAFFELAENPTSQAQRNGFRIARHSQEPHDFGEILFEVTRLVRSELSDHEASVT